ncbi:MAG: Gfo/Idh/MocA family oxidoreductase [Candidatus Thiodiazotropha sp. (ex Cardiolucina cf. quadrata)]|nr:Gfo/Idh/MocA family oxidoreductase [Candidatus Thiodiazotropha sp. (ex Cardiolucina cf. quadrata)]
MDTLRIGVVGAGAIAQRNARDTVASGVATIAGVFDINHKAARDMARDLSAPFFSSYEDMLKSEAVDAVLLSVPHHLHRSMTVQAAEAGKHVLVEKPIANTLSEAEEMIKACNANGVKMTVNYSFRYLPKILKAKQLIDDGALGEITGFQTCIQQYKNRGYWTGASSNSPDDWRASKAKCGGGFLIMTACHNVDYLYYISGLKGTRVYSEYATLGSPAEVEDIISISYRMGERAVGSFSASSIMRGMEQKEERIWGTNGSLLIHPEGLEMYSTRPIDGKRPGKVHKFKKFPNISWTAEWVKGFVNAVRSDTMPPVSYVDAWENLAFITTAYQSMEERRALTVPEFISTQLESVA